MFSPLQELKQLRQDMESRQSEINTKKEEATRAAEKVQLMENDLRLVSIGGLSPIINPTPHKRIELIVNFMI